MNLMPGLYQRSYNSISPRINFKFKGRNYFPDQSNALLTTIFSDVQSIDQSTSKTIVKIFVDNLGAKIVGDGIKPVKINIFGQD